MKIIVTFCILLVSLPAWAGTWKDDFADGDFKEWTIRNILGGNSKWKVESGKLIAERKDDWGSFAILSDSIDWEDYEMSFDVMMEESLNLKFTFVVISVRVSDNSDNFKNIGPALVFNWWDGHRGIVYARGIKGAQGPELADIVEKSYPVEMNNWYNLKLSARGNQFRFYIDDVLQREFTFDGYESGGVAMAAGGCIAHFDNVVISGPEIPNGGPGLSPIQLSSKLAKTWGRIKSR